MQPGVCVLACLTALVSSLIGVSSMPTTAVHASLPSPIEITDPTPRPLGPISVIGDSVLRGALNSPPNLVQQLAARGWGPIRALGMPGLSSGFGNRSFDLTASYWFDEWKRQGWDAPAVVLIIGSNDVGLCAHFDRVCMDGSIRHIVDHVGPDYDLFIPHINHFFTDEWQRPWNSTLDSIAAEHPNVDTWDWDVELENGDYQLDDGVHLLRASYVKWSYITSFEVTKDLGRSTYSGPDAAVPTAHGPDSRFTTVPPTRLTDTRDDERLAPQVVRRIPLDDHLPDDASAVAVYLTAARASRAGHLSVVGCDSDAPATSNVNFVVGRPRGAAAIVAVDPSRELCVRSSASTDIVVDLQGVFTTGTGDLLDVSTPFRAVDTRRSERMAQIEIQLPPGSTAAAVNLTAARSASTGFLAASACDGAPPDTASLNFGPGDTVASAAFVAASTDARICIDASTSVDVIVDVTGTFSPASGLAFRTVEPTRVLDTRNGTGGWGPFHSRHQPLSVLAAPAGVSAVTGTIVMRRPMDPGFLAVRRCNAAPQTSSINAPIGATVANAITSSIGPSGRLCIDTSAATDTILDITGWWVDPK